GQFAPADVQEADLDVPLAFGLADQVPKPAPGRFQFLKGRMMNDGVELVVDEMVYASNRGLNGKIHLIARQGASDSFELIDPIAQRPPSGRFGQECVQAAKFGFPAK